MPTTAQEVYTASVRTLPPTERLRLAALILNELSRIDSPFTAVDSGDTWSRQDQSELTAFTLQYAATLYPEGIRRPALDLLRATGR